VTEIPGKILQIKEILKVQSFVTDLHNSPSSAAQVRS
jgi:hypothetical protein